MAALRAVDRSPQPATARVEWQRQVAWAAPALLAVAVTSYLAWGAWESAHQPSTFFADHSWLHAWLRPTNDGLLLVAMGVLALALVGYWLPRRLQPQVAGPTVIVAMVLVGAALGITSLGQCRGGQSGTSVTAWVLQLYVGQLEPVYGHDANMGCPGTLPLALQLGRIICLGATFASATAAASMLWRAPLGRLRSRMVRDATVLTGLDTLTIPLLRRLTETCRRGSVVVIEPNGAHPLLESARATGARVMIADPTSRRALVPVLSGLHGCALSHLYALQPDVPSNEAVLDAARAILRRYRPDPGRQPHLIARIDDARHADHWRGLHGGTSSQWFEDALSPQESTARALVGQLLRTGARRLLLCGDSTLGLAVLLELARRAWEQRGLEEAEAQGKSASNGAGAAGPENPGRPLLPIRRVLLIDPRAEDLRREYLATSPWRFTPGVLPGVETKPVPWRDHLLEILDAMRPGEAAATAVVIAVPMTDSCMHVAGRVARLYPDTAVLVLSLDGAEIQGAIFDQLRPFQRSVLVEGEPPEDTWTRLARHWHECYRLANPVPAGDPREPSRRPWAGLDDFTRQDNILQLRSILANVALLGREWVPVRAVIEGSFIELTGSELAAVACAEHTRWYLSRKKSGWRPTAGGARSGTLVNSIVVPWEELPEQRRTEHAASIGLLVAQLEDAGFMPAVPAGGPSTAPAADGAARYVRAGAVQARRLSTRRRWTRHNGDELRADKGDWRVIDEGGDDRTVRDEEFRASHTHLGGDRWRRTGVFRAWQVGERTVVRTVEGRSTAEAGDWIVEGPTGVRWPVADLQFQKTYRPARLAG